jgi:hypothetical protein
LNRAIFNKKTLIFLGQCGLQPEPLGIVEAGAALSIKKKESNGRINQNILRVAKTTGHIVLNLKIELYASKILINQYWKYAASYLLYA